MSEELVEEERVPERERELVGLETLRQPVALHTSLNLAR